MTEPINPASLLPHGESIGKDSIVNAPRRTPAPRSTPTEKVDRMRERCGLSLDFAHWDGKHDARGTGRTTLMILHALVAYEAGQSVVIVGDPQVTLLAFAKRRAAAEVPLREPYAARFVDHVRYSRGEVAMEDAVFIDHWAAHQIVESYIGATVMESPY